VTFVDWTEQRLESTIRDANLVVNATTLGWNDTDDLPALSSMTREHGYLDLNYSPRSALMRRARESGAQVRDGLEFLLRQGMEAFRWLTGQPAPEDAMRAALMSPTGGRV